MSKSPGPDRAFAGSFTMASKVEPTKLCTSEGREASVFSSVTKNCSCSIALNTLEYHHTSAIQHGLWTVDTILYCSVELAVEYMDSYGSYSHGGSCSVAEKNKSQQIHQIYTPQLPSCWAWLTRGHRLLTQPMGHRHIKPTQLAGEDHHFGDVLYEHMV